MKIALIRISMMRRALVRHREIMRQRQIQSMMRRAGWPSRIITTKLGKNINSLRRLHSR